MLWNDILLAVNKAASEYSQRDESVPELLWKTKNWVEPKIKFGGGEAIVDIDDLAQLFLQMTGWHL